MGDVDLHFFQARRHGSGIFDIQRLLAVAAFALRAVHRRAVGGNTNDRHGVGLLHLGEIRGDIGGVPAFQLHQPQYLAVAAQMAAAEIGRADIAADEIAVRAGACADAGAGGIACHQPWRGQRVIIQADHMQHGHRQIQRGLAVGGDEITVFGGVAVQAQRGVEYALDIGNAACCVDNVTVGAGANDAQAGGAEELHGLGIIGCRGAETGSEFGNRQVMPVIGAGRVVDVPQQRGESGLIVHRQRDGQGERGRGIRRTHAGGIVAGDFHGHVRCQQRRGAGGKGAGQ